MKKEHVSYAIVLSFGLLLSVAAIASTTITSTVLTAGGLLTVPAGYSLDTAAAGQLNIGTTTATSVVVGSATAKVGIGTTTPFASFSVNSVAGSAGFTVGSSTMTSLLVDKFGNVGVSSSTPYVALGVVGTTTSSAGTVIGALGTPVNQMVFGTCTPTIGSITASTTLSAICTGSETYVNGTGWKVFVTPNITEDKNIVFVSASSTASGIQVTLLNVNNTGVGAVNPTDNAWNWMAVR